MNVIEIAKQVIQTEIQGLDYMSSRIGQEFEQAVEVIISTTGRTIVCGMGKSGIIGKKIAASFASTGTPSFFMHPGEAFHGDLGMVKPEDVFIAVSNSGETDEILKLLPFLRDNGNYIIAITGKCESTLAKHAHCHLDIAVPKEACPLQLAPTTSTTASLVLGDALTVALMDKRDFQPENFARFHPGGNLGRRLLSKVRDEMIVENLPIVDISDNLVNVIHTISSGKLGLTLVSDNNCINGIITDGDLRRAIESNMYKSFDLKAKDIASFSPVTIEDSSYLIEAESLMESLSVTSLLVTSNDNIIGLIRYK